MADQSPLHSTDTMTDSSEHANIDLRAAYDEIRANFSILSASHARICADLELRRKDAHAQQAKIKHTKNLLSGAKSMVKKFKTSMAKTRTRSPPKCAKKHRKPDCRDCLRIKTVAGAAVRDLRAENAALRAEIKFNHDDNSTIHPLQSKLDEANREIARLTKVIDESSDYKVWKSMFDETERKTADLFKANRDKDKLRADLEMAHKAVYDLKSGNKVKKAPTPARLTEL